MKKQDAPITIEQDSFADLLAGCTGNLMADEEIPKMLRTAIKAGRVVLLTEANGKASYKLTLSAVGQFQYVAVA